MSEAWSLGQRDSQDRTLKGHVEPEGPEKRKIPPFSGIQNSSEMALVNEDEFTINLYGGEWQGKAAKALCF